MESVSGPEKLREYSFIGFEPFAIIRIRDHRASVEIRETGEVIEDEIDDPVVFLRATIPRLPHNGGFRFMGGAVGYISYDTVKYWEKLPDLKPKRTNFPDLEFALYSEGVVIDHRMN